MAAGCPEQKKPEFERSDMAQAATGQPEQKQPGRTGTIPEEPEEARPGHSSPTKIQKPVRAGNRPVGIQAAHLRIRDDWLARAVLNFAADGPDALMHASLLGSECPLDLCQTLLEISPDTSLPISARQSQARTQLDRAFIQGAIRWGRQINGKDMDRFRRVSTAWRSRVESVRNWDADRLKESLTEGGTLWVLTPTSDTWPSQLNDLAQRSDWAPPLCLWGRGNKDSLISCSKPVAVVGSRTCDLYGSYIAHEIGRQAAIQGHLVVSGGAMGADAQAHWGALAARGEEYTSDAGSTVAVFAGGLKRMGPLRNRELFQAIERHGGALISEMHPETIPEGRRFLLRNRIIAALASTIVVAQARYRSGALNTATWGAELGREIYAAPGRIDTPENTGCNRLIHQGKATILISATDISGICHAPHQSGTYPVVGSFQSSDLEDDTGTAKSREDTSDQIEKSLPEQEIAVKRQPMSKKIGSKSNKELEPGKGSEDDLPPLEEIPPALEYLTEAENCPHVDPEEVILKAIRACCKKGEAATVDALIRALEGSRFSGMATSSQVDTVQLVLRHLGRLELEGKIETVNGSAHLVKQDQASH